MGCTCSITYPSKSTEVRGLLESPSSVSSSSRLLRWLVKLVVNARVELEAKEGERGTARKVNKAMQTFYRTINVLFKLSIYPMKRRLGDYLAQADVGTLFSKFFEICHEKLYKEKCHESQRATLEDWLWTVLYLCVDLTDASERLRDAFGSCGVITILLKLLSSCKSVFDDERKQMEGKKQETDKEIKMNSLESKVIIKAMSILYNCSLQSSNTKYFNDDRVLKELSDLAQNAQDVRIGNDKSLAPMSQLILAHVLVDDKDKSTSSEASVKILADGAIIEFAVKTLKEAADSSFDHRSKLGFSAHCLMFGIVKLAANDKNSKEILPKALGSLFKMLTKGFTDDHISETASAAKAIWALAFVEENKEIIRNHRKLMKRLELSAATSKNRRLKEASTGALWVLKSLKPQDDRMEVMNTEETTRGVHVMLSYSWAQQSIVLKVKNALQSFGFRVWIDVERMKGSILQAMAEAVEDAAVVLVCMSQNYQDSPNCRAEGEYAHQCRKNVIPLMLEEKFKPTGWLGILLGAKLYHDFTKRQRFNEQVGKLAEELGERGKKSYTA